MKRLTPAFTIVELLIVIVVVGILASFTAVGYKGLTVKARNVARVQVATNMQKILLTADAGGVNSGTASYGRFCLSDRNPEKNPDGTPKCGEAPGPEVAVYHQGLIDALKTYADTLPVMEKVSVWESHGVVYHGPTLEKWSGWVNEDGEREFSHVLAYWLEGSNQDCGLPNQVTFDYSESPVPEDEPGAIGVVRPSGQKYAYTDSRATYCYVPIYASGRL